MGPFRKFQKTRIPEKSRKVTCLTIQKAFNNRQVFQWRPLDCTRIKTTCHSIKAQEEFDISYGDIALRYTVTRSFANLHKLILFI